MVQMKKKCGQQRTGKKVTGGTEDFRIREE